MSSLGDCGQVRQVGISHVRLPRGEQLAEGLRLHVDEADYLPQVIVQFPCQPFSLLEHRQRPPLLLEQLGFDLLALGDIAHDNQLAQRTAAMIRQRQGAQAVVPPSGAGARVDSIGAGAASRERATRSGQAPNTRPSGRPTVRETGRLRIASRQLFHNALLDI